MTTEVKSSPDQASGRRCDESKAASASVAQPVKVAAPATTETPQAEPEVRRGASKGCCCGG